MDFIYLAFPILIQHLKLLIDALLMLLPVDGALLHLALDALIDFAGFGEFLLVDLIDVLLDLLPLCDL